MDLDFTIEKLINKKGLLRTPGYWLQRLFNKIIGTVSSIEDSISNIVDTLIPETNNQIISVRDDLNKTIQRLCNSIYIKSNGSECYVTINSENPWINSRTINISEGYTEAIDIVDGNYIDATNTNITKLKITGSNPYKFTSQHITDDGNYYVFFKEGLTELDLSYAPNWVDLQQGNNLEYCFNKATSLQNLFLPKIICPSNIDLGSCPLSKESIKSIANNLYTASSGLKIKFKKSVYDDPENADALSMLESKGWTVESNSI